MPLPHELIEIEDATCVVGDIDEFLEYFTSGRCYMDWHERMALRQREFAALYDGVDT